MHSGSELFGRNLSYTQPNVEMGVKEQQDSDMKVQESVDNLIRQTIVGKEPFFSFTMAGEGPLQWIHWLDSWDQQGGGRVSTSPNVDSGADAKSNKQAESQGSDSMGNINSLKDSSHSSTKNGVVFGRGLQAAGERLHLLTIPEAVVAFAQAAAKTNDLQGFPLVPPSKAQLQKCDKCVQEFCSPLNYRRHIRMHRRPLNIDKEDLRKARPQVAAFWDKLTVAEADQILLLNNMIFEDLSGASIIKALSGFHQQSGSSFFHQSYLKAGTTLLEIVQNKLSNFPLPSEELFNALDDSSEKTFLCGVLSVSMKRFIFEGEAGKVGMEARNLVAALGFLIEQRLIKAWMAERDEEALRCQKALVEEEEAAQMKRAKLQERKRLKKIRQKELKEKEHKGTFSGLKGLEIDLVDSGSGISHAELDDSPSTLQSSSSVSSGQDLQLEPAAMEFDRFDELANMSFKSVEQDNSQVVEQQTLHVINDGFKMENAAKEDAKIHYSDEDLKLCRPLTSAKFASEQGLNHSWRERKHGSYESANCQGIFYGSDRGFFDVKCHQVQRAAGMPYNMQLAEVHDHSYLPSVNEPYLVARSKQYRDRSLGVRKHAAIVHSNHAVWARKVQQNATPRPEKLGSLDEASKSNGAVLNISVMHDEQLHTEVARVSAKNENTSYIGGQSCSAATVDFSTFNTLPTSCEKSGRALSNDKPDTCLSCDSSILFDCASYQTLVSMSEKGSEEETQDREAGKLNSRTDVYDKASCLSCESVKDHLDVDSCNGALFIGSLSIPLQAFGDLNCQGNPHEKLKRSSRDIQHLPGKKQKGEAVPSSGLHYIDAGGEKKRSQKETKASNCEVSKEGNNTHNVACVGQLYYCESATGLLEANTCQNRINDEIPSISEGYEACSTVKVWRPDRSVGECHQVHVSKFNSTARNGDLPLAPAIDRTADENFIISCPLTVVRDAQMKFSGCNLSLKGSIGDQQEEITEGQIPRASRLGGAAVENKTAAISSKLNAGSTDISVGLELMEKLPLEGSDKWESLCRYVASFLSRRWVDAIAASKE